jgi:hypothetical protein
MMYERSTSELRTLGSLLDALAKHGSRQAVLALQEGVPTPGLTVIWLTLVNGRS